MIDWYDMFKLFVPIFITCLINIYIGYKSSCSEKNKILFSTLELKYYLLQYLQMREYLIKQYANGIDKKQLNEFTTYANGLRVRVRTDKQSLKVQLKDEQSIPLLLKRQILQILYNLKSHLLVLFLLLVVLFFYKLYPMIP